ncbi:MAG TPA: hypothetical protein DDW85_11485 [Porphyromonadaceae bacterium]|nr:hypothetical protein [Porphyromonadaceae bacterium]
MHDQTIFIWFKNSKNQFFINSLWVFVEGIDVNLYLFFMFFAPISIYTKSHQPLLRNHFKRKTNRNNSICHYFCIFAFHFETNKIT